jgi:hypothetical protein
MILYFWLPERLSRTKKTQSTGADKGKDFWQRKGNPLNYSIKKFSYRKSLHRRKGAAKHGKEGGILLVQMISTSLGFSTL